MKKTHLTNMADNLPDVFLMLVFERLSVEDRLNASQVCTNWYHRVRDVNMSVQFLTITVDWSDLENRENCIDWNVFGYNTQIKQALMKETEEENREKLELSSPLNTLHLFSIAVSKQPQLNSKTVQQIITAFPAITELNFLNESGDVAQFEFCRKMLEESSSWHKQLVTLRLKDECMSFKNYDKFYSNSPSTEAYCVQTSKNLYDAINRLPTLKRLALIFTNRKINNRLQSHKNDFSVLSRLKELRINSKNFTPILNFLNSVEQIAADNDDLKIDLSDNFGLDNAKIETINGRTRERIVRLHGNYFIRDTPKLLSTCALFPNLTSLKFDFVFFASALSIISKQLPHLNHIYLRTIENIETFAKSLLPLTTSLPSVKTLELGVSIKSHSDFQLLNLPVTMPNLEAIHFPSYYCCKCNVENKYKNNLFEKLRKKEKVDLSKLTTKSRQCFAEVLPQFQFCGKITSLEQITVMVRYDTTFSAKELLACSN